MPGTGWPPHHAPASCRQRRGWPTSAVAHHRDHTHHTTGEDQTSTAADVVRWTRLPFAAVVPALTTLAAIGWLDGDDTSGYAIAATSGSPPQTHQSRPTT
jgi:hypothetical protein